VIWRAPEASNPLESTSVLAQLSVSAGWHLPWMHTPPTIMRCTVRGAWLYIGGCLRYRDVEARRAKRDASTSLPMRATT
jgi:hypothetical protein